MMTADLEARCRTEVIELHRFFEDWLNGTIADSDERFSRLETVLGDGFQIISPGAQLVERSALLSSLRLEFGSRRDEDAPFRIWTKNLAVREVATDLALVTYEEWQEFRGVTTGRLSSALMRAKSDRPNGVEWLHVHETWLDTP